MGNNRLSQNKIFAIYLFNRYILLTELILPNEKKATMFIKKALKLIIILPFLFACASKPNPSYQRANSPQLKTRPNNNSVVFKPAPSNESYEGYDYDFPMVTVTGLMVTICGVGGGLSSLKNVPMCNGMLRIPTTIIGVTLIPIGLVVDTTHILFSPIAYLTHPNK